MLALTLILVFVGTLALVVGGALFADRKRLAAADKPTANCKFGATAGPDATSLTCEIVAGPTSVKGQTITLTRDMASGAWSCAAATVPQKLIGAEAVCKGMAEQG